MARQRASSTREDEASAALPGTAAITRGDAAVIATALVGLGILVGTAPEAFSLVWVLVYAVAAACAVETARNLRWFVSDDYPLFVALSLGLVAALQLLHVAIELRLPPLPASTYEAGSYVSLITGFALGISMLVAPLTIGRRIHAALWLFVSTCLVGALVVITLWPGVPGLLLQASLEPTTERTGSLVVAGMLCVAVALTWVRRRLLERNLATIMLLALVVAVIGWTLEATLPSDSITHLMSVLFVSLIYVGISRNGLARPAALLVARLRDEREQATRRQKRALRELRDSEQVVRKLALHDALTGLANRDLLGDRLRQAVAGAERSGRSLAVLHVNIDRFAHLNHLLGHAGADEVLREVAVRLSPLVRETDTVARWGTNEFVLVLADVPGSESARRVASAVRDALQSPWRIRDKSFPLSASVGIAVHPGDGPDGAALLQHSEIAAQEARARGGDTWQFYDHAMGREVSRRVELEGELRAAIANGELVLFYQPQVDLTTGAVAAVEALVRWRHPAHGLLSPGVFLPVAESTRLIEELTTWVIDAACNEAARWQNEERQPMRVAVNTSARDFVSGTLVSTIDAALEAHALDPEHLEIELTETAVLADMQATASQLSVLRSKGISTALDDFGTGYSSLTHLHSLPITRVKIDRSFISTMLEDKGAAAIVRSMLALIQSLGLESVAEGVECEEQASLLRTMGCTLGQGYHFAPPLSAESLVEWALERGGVSLDRGSLGVRELDHRPAFRVPVHASDQPQVTRPSV